MITYYGNVIFDKEKNLYKDWYCPFIVDYSARGMTLEQRRKEYEPPPNREIAICYAISKDGIHGEIINLEILNWYQLVMLKWDKRLKEGLGKEIPADANPSMEYDGPPFIMVDSVRTNLYGNEPLKLKVRDIGELESVILFYRPLGKGKYKLKKLTHVDRGLYKITLPP